jgi:hypothetical protein
MWSCSCILCFDIHQTHFPAFLVSLLFISNKLHFLSHGQISYFLPIRAFYFLVSLVFYKKTLRGSALPGALGGLPGGQKSYPGGKGALTGLQGALFGVQGSHRGGEGAHLGGQGAKTRPQGTRPAG